MIRRKVGADGSEGVGSATLQQKSKFKVKMAPISEKRSQPPNANHVKENGHTSQGHGHTHLHTHAKENASSNASGKSAGVKSKGLEILDFHESWLEEVELYKDKLYVQKNLLLSSHNHAHTPHGCQIDAPSHYISVNNQYVVNATATHGGHMPNEHSSNNNNYSIMNGTIVKRRGGSGGTSVTGCTVDPSIISNASHNKSNRISIRSNTAAPLTSHVDSTIPMTGVQLLLKRPRDEPVGAPKSVVHNSKRHSHPHPPHTQSNTSPRRSASPAKRLGGGGGGGVGTSVGGAVAGAGIGSVASAAVNGVTTTINANDKSSFMPTSQKALSKIIVNQFHASSLLNDNDKKSELLTQNGLNKTAATAYETSVYASQYMPLDNRTYHNRHPIVDNSTYVGVSLAKGGDGDRAKRSSTPEDDPCAAIDVINDYSDSDSDEEYTGFPFYLANDLNEIHQSQHIRFQRERQSNDSTEDSEADTEASKYFKPKCILSPSIFPNVPPYLNFSSHAEKGPQVPPALHRVLKWKLSPVMPKIVKRVVLNSGFRIIKNTTDWMAIWEKHMKSPGFRTIRSHQKYNHMPGSFRIGRKDSMWRSIHNNMKRFGKKEFGFMQKSYVMPDDLESLRQVWPKNASMLTKWIVKPPASARGTGIRIVNKWSQFPKDRPLVVQKYIERPLLINDSKFDMRIYVLVTSINPLRIYMYKDGLARFASVKYSSELTSLDDRCMHLTNYSINKFSQNYSKNEDFNACQGHKWTLQSLWSCLETRGVNTKRLWATLRNLVIKAIVSGESGLNRMYRQNVNFRYNCFELFGFDVLLDENLVPWLLEINISPSLHSELPLDLHVKGPLLQAVMNTALYQVPPKLNEKQQKEILHELNLQGPLCHDKRIFTTCLTAEEVRKHNQFTNRTIEFREEYLDSILDNLLPDDIRCLIITEDEYARCAPLERIFPTADTHTYLKFIDNPRYYNRLLDAWETRYGNFREQGIALLKGYCVDGYHLNVSDAALEKEPDVALTEIDMLHQKKSDDQVTLVPDGAHADSALASKAGTPDSTADVSVRSQR
ncbi:PREDICTED: tubulin polyglutamylase TTLL4 isoform X1 [Rhagoletis zephyria]|uniref:tubulin polyglutamylase TTLL4 isoform X1 n=1 Tax=Rhagoletis zephyria TaxID=28612 RepID=UPI0008119145|nr:PREDICTED: tubulin polyglutamylase TTLL4 isoform X1 [Rhagoletis zephyria]